MKAPITEACNGALCEDIVDICYTPDPQKIYVCTRKAGHPGPHIACSGGNHNLKKWPQSKKRMPGDQK